MHVFVCHMYLFYVGVGVLLRSNPPDLRRKCVC